jgi:membrane associated rhomboid family serine protease
MLRLTPIVKNILIINVVIFVAQYILPVIDFSCFPGQYSRMNLVSGYLSLWSVKSECFKPYQLFTYMFVHGGPGHIFFNMLGLVFFGPALESFWGTKRFTLFYMITGIGAGVFNILMDLFFGLGSFDVMAGASGAVYGVLTAFGVIFPNMELRLLFLPISFRAKYLVMALGAIAIYSGFKASPGDDVAHFAHLGGIVIGIILVQIWRGRGHY